MLTQCSVHTTIPVADMARAKRWYEEKLGFKPASETQAGAVYDAAGGSRFVLYPSPNAGQAPQTVMAFAVTQIESEVRTLKDLGVKFEEYDMPGLKTVGSIASFPDLKAAWFRDCEGNIIGVVQPSG